MPTACYLAKAGYKVTGVDLNKNKIRVLKQRRLPFEEPGLSNNKKLELKFVKQAAKDISKVLRNKNLVIIESTVPPGTAEKVILPILKKGHKNYKIYLAHTPERVIPGRTLKEMAGNERIIGGIDTESTNLTKKYIRLL